jgi:hypothetical protein
MDEMILGTVFCGSLVVALALQKTLLALLIHAIHSRNITVVRDRQGISAMAAMGK